jgi:hypothetical protein
MISASSCNREFYISPHNAILQSIINKKYKFTFSNLGRIDCTVKIPRRRQIKRGQIFTIDIFN